MFQAQATAKPYSEFLRENGTTSIINAMEANVRYLKSMLPYLKASRELNLFKLEHYKYLYQEEQNFRKSLQCYLNE